MNKKIIKNIHPSKFKLETTTFWSFKDRGKWATHSGNYRGNWSPYIPRNIILRYSKLGDTVLDCFCGSGTTLIEAKLLGRKGIGVDVNEDAVRITKENLNFEVDKEQLSMIKIYEPEVYLGDARDLGFIADKSVDLICTHPPYANAIKYSPHNPHDLSRLDVNKFLEEMDKVAKGNYRVLKNEGVCAVLIGDVRRNKYVVPLGFMLIKTYLKNGFRIEEIVIKEQHNCRATPFWMKKSIKHNFLLLAHEYLVIFRKSTTKLEKQDKTQKINLGIKKQKIQNINKPSSLNEVKPETKTVWKFDKDVHKNKTLNLLKLYSKTGGCVLVDVKLKDKNIIINKTLIGEEHDMLIFNIHPPSLTKYAFEDFMNKVINLIKHEKQKLKKGDIVCIDTTDVRVDGYVQSIPLYLIETLELLKIKEIIILKEEKLFNFDDKDSLKRTHSYILVFEVLSD